MTGSLGRRSGQLSQRVTVPAPNPVAPILTLLRAIAIGVFIVRRKSPQIAGFRRVSPVFVIGVLVDP